MVNAIATRSVSGSMRPFLDGVVYFIAYLLLDLFFILFQRKRKRKTINPLSIFYRILKLKFKTFSINHS